MQTAREPQRNGPDLGFRRGGWIRVEVGEQEIRAELIGQSHRRLRAVTIPLTVAARLAAEGMPLVVNSTTRASVGTGVSGND